MNLDEYVKQLETLVNIDCGSHNKNGIEEVASHISNWYEQINWKIKKHIVDENTGPVLEIFNNNDEHYDVMFIGHMDTVFPDGTAAKRPFSRKYNLCFGPGVEDMKSGDLAMLHIAKNISEDINSTLNICMCYNPDEEISSRYSRDLLKKIGKKADRIIVMESSQDNGAAHVFERKGKSNYIIEFSGIACHAGFIFDNPNASAIEEMGHFIYEISKLKNKEKKTSINVGIANGGSAVNAVADKAIIHLEARFDYLQEKKRICESIDHLIKNPSIEGCKITVKEYYESDPWKQSDKGNIFIEKIKDIASKMNIPFYGKKRGGLSDANHLAKVCDVIIDGMGPFGAFAHSEKEYMDLRSVEPCIDLILNILNEIKNGSC